jgi:RHS repeat-associated protein
VTVNGLTAYRKVEYFRQQLSVTNTNAVWQSVSNASPGQTSVTGHVYVAKAPETYTYDADGNLLSDGRWTYTWDGENRLVGLTSFTNAPAGSQLQLAFAYDYMGRRIQKIVLTNSSGTNYIGEYTNKYAYDGWNCLAIFNPSLSLSNSFLWGSDLSGSLQGAGGVGGLLKVSYYGAAITNCFVAFDGNGNVSALINASNGVTVANYDYGPFGEVIRLSGPMAKLNPFRFSTKYDDDETDFLYYGYRYYNPSTGRWPSRDPIDELAFALTTGQIKLSRKGSTPDSSAFVFVKNCPSLLFDKLGLFPIAVVDYDSCMCSGPLGCGVATIGSSYSHLVRLVQQAVDQHSFPSENAENVVDCFLACKTKRFDVQCGGACCKVQKGSAQACSYPGGSTVYLCTCKGTHSIGTAVMLEMMKGCDCLTGYLMGNIEYEMATWLDNL